MGTHGELWEKNPEKGSETFLGKVWQNLPSGRALPGNGDSSESSPRLEKIPRCQSGLGLELTHHSLPQSRNLREFLGAVRVSGRLEQMRWWSLHPGNTPKLRDKVLESLENTWGWDSAGLGLVFPQLEHSVIP